MKRFSYDSIVAVTLLGAGLMTVSVRAQNGTADCEDRITSGGWIVIPEVGTANFGASGGLHKGEFWGQLNYVDKEDAGIHVRAQDVVGYCRCPGRDECRRITYSPAWVDGVQVEFVYVEVCDTGEPGVGDTFGICIPEIGYCREGVLGGDDKPSGGNIQLHKQTGTCGEAIDVCNGPPIGCECFEQCN